MDCASHHVNRSTLRETDCHQELCMCHRLRDGFAESCRCNCECFRRFVEHPMVRVPCVGQIMPWESLKGFVLSILETRAGMVTALQSSNRIFSYVQFVVADGEVDRRVVP